MSDDNTVVLDKLCELYEMLLEHDGFGELRVELRMLKRGQKEVIIRCGKQYRYVVDFPPARVPPEAGLGEGSSFPRARGPGRSDTSGRRAMPCRSGEQKEDRPL